MEEFWADPELSTCKSCGTSAGKPTPIKRIIFEPEVIYELGFGDELGDLALEDIDVDGDLDAIATVPGNAGTDSRVVLWRNNGDGSYAAPAFFLAGEGPIGVAVADFTNGDDVTAVLASGGYSVSLVPTGGGEELFQADLDLSEGTGYVVYGVGSVDGGSFDAAVQVLGQFFQTPEGVPSGSGGLAGDDSSSLPLLAVGISLLLLGFVVAVRPRRREPTI